MSRVTLQNNSHSYEQVNCTFGMVVGDNFGNYYGGKDNYMYFC